MDTPRTPNYRSTRSTRSTPASRSGKAPKPHPAANARFLVGAASIAAMGGMVGGLSVSHILAANAATPRSTSGQTQNGAQTQLTSNGNGDDGQTTTQNGDDGQTTQNPTVQGGSTDGSGFTQDPGATPPNNNLGGPSNGRSHGS